MASAANGLNKLQQLLKAVANRPGFDKVIGPMQAVSGGNGNCCCKMIVKKQHENRNGLLHGGMVATLVDVVSTAGLMTSDWAAPGVSIELSVSYIKPAKVGDEIVIDAKILKLGRTLAFTITDILDSKTGSLIAQGKHTKMLVKPSRPA